MNKLISVFLLLTSTAVTQAQTKFFEGTYQEAFATARKLNKNLFIDCYTDWCGWCKVADEKTFPVKEVGEFLNENFICVKVDMERGKGVHLGMKYRVLGYPSYLMFTPDGKLAHRLSGYTQDPLEFVEQVKVALDENKRPDYPSKLGDAVSFPEFYEKAFTNKDLERKRSTPETEEVISWLKDQDDLTTETAWSVIYRFGLDETFNKKFLDARSEYEKLYGKIEVRDKVSSIADRMLRKAMKSQDEADLKIAIEFADQHMGDEKEEVKAYYKMKFCEGKGDWTEYAKCAQGIIDFHGLENHLGGINNYSWTIYLEAEKEEVLNTAIGWMAQVVKLEPLYMYLDTYAALLYKTGRYDDALEWADKAISTGKQKGENVEETEELKAKIIDAKEAK